MDYRRYLVEAGTGIDLHGEDATKAAQRAVKDAISHSSLVGLSQLFKIESFSEMEDALMVDVTIAAPDPEKVDGEKVLSTLPEGKRRIRIVKGGLKFPDESTKDEAKTHPIVMVNAVIVVLVDVDKVPRK
ncbi:MAG: Lin0512 family protein [Candidatus Bathyarchaeota archaeon]|nr:Lin0512 family protein [Candidatus Bathyarchaeota archaeon]